MSTRQRGLRHGSVRGREIRVPGGLDDRLFAWRKAEHPAVQPRAQLLGLGLQRLHTRIRVHRTEARARLEKLRRRVGYAEEFLRLAESL